LLSIQWNELLGNYGDITWQVRTASTEAGLSGASWSSAVTSPTGSDLTGVSSGEFIQLRANLSTSNIEYTPYIFSQEGYLVKVFYYKSGSSKEAAFLSLYSSGWRDMGAASIPKFIKHIKVYYMGTEGTATITYSNDEGDVSRSFDIDFSVDPSSAPEEEGDYVNGDNTYKVYNHYPSENTELDPGPVGEKWKFDISENGDDEWSIHRIEVRYELVPIH